jgi:hypothetical protein
MMTSQHSIHSTRYLNKPGFRINYKAPALKQESKLIKQVNT